MARTELDSRPAETDITTAMRRTWTFDFSPALADGELLASAEAVLIGTSSVPGREITIPDPDNEGETIPAFVETAAVAAPGSVAVSWSGEGLTVGAVYVLHTRATVDNVNEDVVVLLTRIRVVG